MAVQDRPSPEALSAGGTAAAPAGVALVITAMICGQLAAALARTLFDDVSPAGVALLRVTFAAVILMALWRPQVRGRSARELRMVVALGLFIGTMNLTFYEALDRLPLGVAVTIEFAGPLAVAIALSHRRRDVAWAALAAVGVVLLANPGGSGVDLLGVMLALLAGVCWGGYIVVGSTTARTFTGGRGLALALTAAIVVPVVPGVLEAGSRLFDVRWLALSCAVAVAGTVMAYTLEASALRRLPAQVFGVLMSLQPAVAAIVGYLILSQRLDLREIVAIGFVVIASLGATRTPAAVAPEP